MSDIGEPQGIDLFNDDTSKFGQIEIEDDITSAAVQSASASEPQEIEEHDNTCQTVQENFRVDDSTCISHITDFVKENNTVIIAIMAVLIGIIVFHKQKK